MLDPQTDSYGEVLNTSSVISPTLEVALSSLDSSTLVSKFLNNSHQGYGSSIIDEDHVIFAYQNTINDGNVDSSLDSYLIPQDAKPSNWLENVTGVDSNEGAQTVSTEQSYTPLSNSFSEYYGDGLINAAAAVAYAIGQPIFADVPDVGGYLHWGLDTINVPEVWTQGYTGEDVIVAVVDTGVDWAHSDLNDNIWINPGEIFGNGYDDDGNGYVDDIVGWNFVDGDYWTMDYDGHGTHVAGIIAAEGNDFGVTGVAYNAKIMPVKVSGENGGTHWDIAQGIVYAADNGADVINLSLGGDYSYEVEWAIQYATELGAIVVMAAGNNGPYEPIYPAALATDWGIAVGAIARYWDMADFSNRAGYDSSLYYVVAPGVDIYSTYSIYAGYEYKFFDGTSMAAPHVSGVAALMLSANPDLTPDQIRGIISYTAIG